MTAGTAGITPCCCLSKKQEILENIKETWFNDVKHSQRLSVCELNQYFCANAHKNGSRWILAFEQPKHGALCSAEGLIHTNIYTSTVSSKTRVSINKRQLSSQLMAARMALQLCRLSCREAQLRFCGAAMDTPSWGRSMWTCGC